MTELNSIPCDICGATGVREEIQNQEFVYGNGAAAVTLQALVTMMYCTGCQFSFTDHRAEDARHQAICAHLGVLPPNQIVRIREALGMGRMQFADLLGVGIASLQRWESGSSIQNASIDNLIRLAQRESNAKALQSRDFNSDTVSKPLRPRGKRRFSRLTNIPRAEALAQNWPLRPGRRYQCT